MTDTTPIRVWFFANFEETADTTSAYTALESTKHAAIIDYEAGDTGPGLPGDVYRWDVSDESGHHLLFEGELFTGYWVQPLEVVGDGFETEWTVASHWRHSVEYGPSISEERARSVIREEHDPGVQLSIASRVASGWRHEDPEAQRHADAINAAVKAGA
jgi:hypothetical protein